MKKGLLFILVIVFLILSSFTLIREGFDMMIEDDKNREEGSYEDLNEEGQTKYCADNLTFDKCPGTLTNDWSTRENTNCRDLLNNCDSTLEILDIKKAQSYKFQVVYIVPKGKEEIPERKNNILNAIMNVQKNIINKTRVDHHENFPNGMMFSFTDTFWKIDNNGLHKMKWNFDSYDDVDRDYANEYTVDDLFDGKTSVIKVHEQMKDIKKTNNEFDNFRYKFMYFVEDGQGGYCFSATISKSNSQSLILLNDTTTGRKEELGYEVKCKALTSKFNGLHMYNLEQDDVLTFRLTHEMLHNLGRGHLDNNNDNTDVSNALYSQTSGNSIPDFDKVSISKSTIDYLLNKRLKLERHFLILEKPLSNDTPIIGNFSYNDLKEKIKDVQLKYSLHGNLDDA